MSNGTCSCATIHRKPIATKCKCIHCLSAQHAAKRLHRRWTQIQARCTRDKREQRAPRTLEPPASRKPAHPVNERCNSQLFSSTAAPRFQERRHGLKTGHGAMRPCRIISARRDSTSDTPRVRPLDAKPLPCPHPRRNEQPSRPIAHRRAAAFVDTHATACCSQRPPGHCTCLGGER